jgi:hypothetical protein
MNFFTKDRPLQPSWQLIQSSIDSIKNNFSQITYLYLIPSLGLTLAFRLMSGYDFQTVPTDKQSVGIFVACIFGIWATLTTPGYLYMQIDAIKGRHITARDAFRAGIPRLWTLIGASLILTVLFLIALILLAAPFVPEPTADGTPAGASSGLLAIVAFWALLLFVLLLRFFGLAPYYIVRDKTGAIEGLRRSIQAAKPVSAYIWGVIGVTIVFLIGALLLSGLLPGIGDILETLLLLPLSFAFAMRYIEITDTKGPTTEPTSKKPSRRADKK